jgi:hypothetical protein
VQILDEPTSGLDSTSSFKVLQVGSEPIVHKLHVGVQIRWDFAFVRQLMTFSAAKFLTRLSRSGQGWHADVNAAADRHPIPKLGSMQEIFWSARTG